MIEWVITFVIIGYCLFIVYLWLGWERIPISSNADKKPSVTVIIPVRNEAANVIKLINDLQNQSYNGKLEILIVNDHSEDESKKLIVESIASTPNFKLLRLTRNHGKKAAITLGVKETSAEIILTTDGDCRVPNTWVETMVHAFSTQTQFISGPVKFNKEDGFFKILQSIEFASLIGSGAALIGWGKPVMANGANLGFRRDAFLEVGGFEGNEETASGDDVFLLHKIANKYLASVAFVKNEEAVVQTKSQPTIRAFIQQRIRWASKWKAYTDLFTKIIALLVFLVSLSLILFPILVTLQKTSLFFWVNLLVIKSFFDYFFIRQVSKYLGDGINFFAFLLLQLIYPFYVVFIALLSFQKSYAWKGRKVQ